MSELEALNYFRRRKEMYLDDKIQEYENEAIKALEKQIPKKPTHLYDNGSCNAFCPSCKGYVGLYDCNHDGRHFCQWCGQNIDWSESEES